MTHNFSFMGKTVIFKRLTHLPRVRMFEDYIKEFNFIYENNQLFLTFLKEARERNRENLQAFKAAQKRERAFNSLSDPFIYISCTLCS